MVAGGDQRSFPIKSHQEAVDGEGVEACPVFHVEHQWSRKELKSTRASTGTGSL